MLIHSHEFTIHHLLVLTTDDGVEDTGSDWDKTQVVDDSPSEIHSDAVEHATAQHHKLENGAEVGVQEDEAGRVDGDVGS